MKYNISNTVVRFRKSLATLFAICVVLGVPVLSFAEIGHFHVTPDRPATKLPAFQSRAIDASTIPVQLFKQPLISVTFDDGWETTYNQAMPLLQKYGIHTTQYILSGTESESDYLSWSQIDAMHKDGEEIACHTITHPDLRTISNADIMMQLTGCDKTLSDRYGKITDFASPYGSQDARTIGQIKKVFSSQRNTNGDPSNGVTQVDVNTSGGYDGKGFDKYNIIGVTIRRETTIAEIQALISFAEQNNGWVVITYHQADDGQSKWGIDTKSMEAQLAAVSKSPIRIVTVDQALSGYKAGK
jgi:peptidoglycan/xylan/chitin deacetylase (PgdA/CDA1 family)